VREIPRESLSQRRWRESRTITALDGEIVLDAETGVPLAAKLAAQIGFSRDGRRFAMKLSLDAQVTKLGAAPIAAPAEAEVVATPARRGEVDERDYLLHGIAPPIKKNKDGTAAKPIAPPGAGSASATGSGSAAGAGPDKKIEKKKPDTKKERKKDDGNGEKKVEPKPEPKSEPKAEPKPQPKADPKPEPP
jgi:hypothetical protein